MPKPLAPCGTPAAYARHRRHLEEPCDPCKEAHATDLRQRARAAGVKEREVPAGCGTDRGYYRHRSLKEDACDLCREAHADAYRRQVARYRAKKGTKVCDCGRVIRAKQHDMCSICRKGVPKVGLAAVRDDPKRPIGWKPRKGILVPVYQESEVA